jgi:hypothetical protein
VLRRFASSAQARVDDEASQLFLHDLLQDVTVQREVRDQVLKLRILLAQLPELAQRAQAQPRILLLPNVEVASLIPCSRQMSATLVPPSACRIARKICSFVCPLFATCVSSSCSPQRTAPAASNSTYPWLAFRVLGQSVLAAKRPGGSSLRHSPLSFFSSASHFVPAGRLKLERFAIVFQRTDSKLAWLLPTSEAVGLSAHRWRY